METSILTGSIAVLDEIGEDESISFDDLTGTHTDGCAEHRPVSHKRVKLAVLAAWVDVRRQIGEQCIVGEKTYIAYGVRIGDYVKVNAQAYVCTGVTLEDRVFVAAGVVFTNDRFPRAFADGHDGLAPSEPNEDTLETVVRTGATIGARAVIGS